MHRLRGAKSNVVFCSSVAVPTMASLALSSFRLSSSDLTACWFARASRGFVRTHSSPFFSTVTEPLSALEISSLSAASGALSSGSSALVVCALPTSSSFFFWR